MARGKNMTNMITEPIQTSRALLTWQRPLEQFGTRDRLAVAELVQRKAGVEFSYLDEKHLAQARKTGFSGYPGLALENQHEINTATDILTRRLPPRNRPDFQDFMETFGLSSQAHFSELSLLAYTGARMTSDSFGVTETFEGFDRPFRYIFDVSGYRHYRKDDLNIDEPVAFRHEPTNQHDPNAVEVVRQDGARLGYVNRLQAPSVLRWLGQGRIEARVFSQNGRSVYPRLFVMADIHPDLRGARAMRESATA